MGEDKERRDTSDMPRKKWKLKPGEGGVSRYTGFSMKARVKDQNDKEREGD